MRKHNFVLISAVVILLFMQNYVSGTPPKLPLTLSGKTTISTDGKNVSVDCDLSCPETLKNVIVDININNGDRLLSFSPAGLVSFGTPFVDSIEKMTRYSFSLDMEKMPNFSFKVAPDTKGDHKIYIRAISQIDETTAWGDGYSFYYHNDGSFITEGYRELDRDFRTQAVQVTPGTFQECPQPASPPASAATPPENNVKPPNPLGTVIVTGRWMFFDENDNYLPQSERLCELFDGNDNHLAWTNTDSNGYFSFPAVTTPSSLYVAARTETYYNRAGGTDHLWVRNSAGAIYGVYSSMYSTIPDGTYNIGELAVPNGHTYEKGYWAIKKIQDTWRYIYFLDTVNMYPGSIQCQWYPGSTDGTYYNFNEMIHLAENDPKGTLNVAHECGHNIMNTAYGGTWPLIIDCPNPHYVEETSGPVCAWLEGWADLIPAAVFNSPVLSWPSGSTVNIETPTWGTPIWDNGADVEGRVAGALWDIVDTNNEANNDFYTDSILDIWETVWNVNNDTFCQFWDSSKNYGIKRSRDNCLYQNTIDSCATCAEDASEDDDSCAQAWAEGVPSNYNYEHCTDADYQYLDAQLDWTYTWETNDLGYSGDTTLTLYAADCSTQLGYNNDKNTGNWPRSSKLVWASDRNARVYIACKENGDSYGSHRSYDISVSRACSTTPSVAYGLSPAYEATVCTANPSLSWSGSGRNYDVIVDNVTVCSATTSNTCGTSGLVSGWHWWYVISRNGCGNTSQTVTYWFYVGASPSSGTTSAVDESPCADAGVTVTWAAPSSWGDGGAGTRTYSVYRSDAVYVATGLSEGTLSYNDNTGTNGTSYNYSVRAINQCGLGQWYSASAPAADYVGGTPSSMSTTTADNSPTLDTGVDISWLAPSNWNDNGYSSGSRTFFVRRDSTLIGTFGEGTLGMNDNLGSNNVSYSYSVYVANGCAQVALYSSQIAMDAVSASPGESSPAGSPMIAAPSTGTSVQVIYSGTSCDTDHSIYWGISNAALSGLAWTGSACSLGDSGNASFDPGDPPAGSFFYFAIVGNNGSIEGSYGKQTGDVERVASTACFSSSPDTSSCI
jgi:hypothetical protein